MKTEQKNTRRDFVKKSVYGSIGIGAGMSVASTFLQSFASPDHFTFEGDPNAKNEKEFRMGVIGPAELSLVTSQIAVQKATQKNAKEFAGFELEEAIAVTTILKELGTPVPQMDAKAKMTLEKIKSAAAGNDFDKAYISAQLENHEFLRDLAQNYLNNSKNLKTPAESHTRHLATLALAVFKEHVAITKRILSELG